MWIGVLYLDEDDREPEDDPVEHVLLVYEPQRILVVGGPLTGLPQAAMNLRAAATKAGPGATEVPRCAHCGADLGVPDYDSLLEPCASS